MAATKNMEVKVKMVGGLGGQLGMSWLFVIEYTALRNDSEDCALWKDTVWLT